MASDRPRIHRAVGHAHQTLMVVPNTPAALIDFMCEHAGRIGRNLRITTSNTPESDDLPLLGATSLDREFQLHAGRFKRLAIESSSVPGLQGILKALRPHTVLENLEYLAVKIPLNSKNPQPPQSWDGGPLFQCTAPQLRRVLLVGPVAPWDLPLFKMAPIEALISCLYEPGSGSGFMSWLERHPGLRHLVIDGHHWKEESTAVLGPRKLALRLSSMETFALRSHRWTVLLAVLRLIRFDPATISRVEFLGILTPPALPSVADFWSAFQQAFALLGCFSPQRISFSTERTLTHCEKIVIEANQRRASDDKISSRSPNGLSVALSSYGKNALLSSPSSFQDIWSFNAVTDIAITGTSLPAELWNLLRRSPALQTMSIDYKTFPAAFPTLRMNADADMIMGAARPPTGDVSPWLAPFPGLLRLEWQNMPSEWRPLRFEERIKRSPQASPCTDAQAFAEYIRDVVYALRIRRKTMEEASFSEGNRKDFRLKLFLKGVKHNITKDLQEELAAEADPQSLVQRQCTRIAPA